MKNLSVRRTTSGNLPDMPFLRMKEAILGSDYELSIAFISPEDSRRITKTYKKKNAASNVLAFPLSEHSGELLLSLGTIRSQAKTYGKTYHEFLLQLLIHGMLHLKGYQHGSTMESKEQQLVRRFS